MTSGIHLPVDSIRLAQLTLHERRAGNECLIKTMFASTQTTLTESRTRTQCLLIDSSLSQVTQLQTHLSPQTVYLRRFVPRTPLCAGPEFRPMRTLTLSPCGSGDLVRAIMSRAVRRIRRAWSASPPSCPASIRYLQGRQAPINTCSLLMWCLWDIHVNTKEDCMCDTLGTSEFLLITSVISYPTS